MDLFVDGCSSACLSAAGCVSIVSYPEETIQCRVENSSYTFSTVSSFSLLEQR